MSQLSEVLDRASRCVLAFAAHGGPRLSPLAFWADGAALWMSTPAASVKAKALRTHPHCSVFVADPDAPDTGLVIKARARVYGLHDPVGLAVHSAVVSAAMTALAGRNTGSVLGYLQDARNVPRRFRPHNRVAVRLHVEDVAWARRPDPGQGIAPPLPPVIPADVRRALAGRRAVVVATQEPGRDVVVGPAIWGSDYAVEFAEGLAPATGARCAVHVGEDVRQRPTDVVGVSLMGACEQGRFRPERAVWWEGFTLRSADIPPSPTTLDLPD